MKLIALILSLALEHVATRRLKLLELRFFDPYFDFGLAQVRRLSPGLAAIVLAAFLTLAIAPVFWISRVLEETFVPWDLPYLAFAVLIVFLCLGPRDLGSEVDDYCAALDAGDSHEARRVMTELSESRHASPRDVDVVEEAIFVQATNRIFGVAFWFIVLGPVGAWLFRVSDLLRRRAAFESARDYGVAKAGLPAAERVHGVLAWVPARLAALGYALAGSFDDAVNGWRNFAPAAGKPFHVNTERLTAVVGKAAMTGFLERPANSSAAARNALRLVMRTLFIWITVIALMTIFGWAV
jgi:membrane protein required for beta-lactamase induction